MAQFTVIESKQWRNVRTQATASVYGAVPYHSASDQGNWVIELVGYTIMDTKRGTVGIGRRPFATFAQAQAWIDRGHGAQPQPPRDSLRRLVAQISKE